MLSAPSVAGLDIEGFLSRGVLCEAASSLTRAEFVRGYPRPALIMSVPAEVASRAAARPSETALERASESSLQRTRIVEQRPAPVRPRAATERYLERVAFLQKRPGNPFPHMVSIGRSMSNDVVVLVDTVSKFQGYFISREGGWSFTDQHSANGTLVNGEVLEKGVRRPLADGDCLRFGAAVEALFLEPASLFAMLRMS